MQMKNIKQPNPTPAKICRMCLALHHKALSVTFLEGLCLKVKKVSSEGSHFFPVTKSESEWDNQLPSLHLAGLAEEGGPGKPNGLCYYTLTYHKVASRSTSWLVAHPSIFRMFMKGKFDAYVLWPAVSSVSSYNAYDLFWHLTKGIGLVWSH